MNRKLRNETTKNITFLIVSIIVGFSVIEIGYRLVDPFPYFGPDLINHTDHGNLSTHDPVLGWKGIPGGETRFTTENNSVWLAHNRQGHRDIEHVEDTNGKPAIVFLGDSFAWGYEVEFKDMFVNRLRERLTDYEIYNLAHRGYSTDQELILFKQWHTPRPLAMVVLMFCENDVAGNNSSTAHLKPKPVFRHVDGELRLTGVPVPKIESWTDSTTIEREFTSWKTFLKGILFHSHFLHDIDFRFEEIRSRLTNGSSTRRVEPIGDLTVTSAILQELNKEVEKRGGKLIVCFIPSKLQIENIDGYKPYQANLADLCDELAIESIDMAPYFEKQRLRTYFRIGMHWNRRGHDTAADALHDYLIRK